MKKLYTPLINLARKSLVLASEIALVSWTLISLPFYKYPDSEFEELDNLDDLEMIDSYPDFGQYNPKKDLLSKVLDHGFPNPSTYTLRERYFTPELNEHDYDLIHNNNPNLPR